MSQARGRSTGAGEQRSFSRRHQPCANKPAGRRCDGGELGNPHLLGSRTWVMDPQCSTSGGWYGAGGVPDSATAAMPQSQPMSPCPLGPRRQAGDGVWWQRGARAPVHTLPPGGRWVMDEACPSLRAEIIPSLPAPPARGRHLSHTRADVTPQDPSQGGLAAPSSFSQGQGLRAPRPGLQAGGFTTAARSGIQGTGEAKGPLWL